MNILDYSTTQYIEWDTALPTLSGTATTEIGKPGATATIFVGNKEFVVPVDPLTGEFSITLTEPMLDGDYSVAIRITDKAGNVGAPFLRTLRVDTLPPDAPDLLNLFDDQNNQQGSFDPGQTVDDKRPLLTGIAQKGTTVYLRDEGNNIIGSTQADPISGKWVIEPDINLNDGVNKLTLVAEETFNDVKRLGTPSAPFAIVIGEGNAVLQHDNALTSEATDTTAGQDDRTLAYQETRYLEQDTSLPTISGTARSEINKPGAVALLSVGGKYYELEVDPQTGAYNWTATEAMPDGDYSVYVAIRDRAGNVGQPKLETLRIDTTPPEAPDLINLFDDQGLKTGSFDAGQTTDDTRPTLTGIAQPGTIVFLRDESGNTLGTAQADKVTGKWVIEPTVDLKEGANNLTLLAQEAFAGKTRIGTPSAPFTIVIGADEPILPPNTITINEAVDDVGTWTGKLSSGALTDDTTPTLRGDVSAGNSVMIYYRLTGSQTWIGSAQASVSGTEWSWTPLSALPYGEYEFQASIGDYSSSLFMLDIATAADIVKKTIIESVKDDFGTWQGELSSGAITDDATPTFSGRGEANGKVVLRFTQPGQPANTVTLDVDSSGHWTWTPASDLLTGNWNFNVQPLGETNWSETFALIITGSDGFKPVIDYAEDDLPPGLGNLSSGSTTNDTTPTLHGRAEANSVVVLRYSAPGQSVTTLSLTADSSGHWSWTPPTLSDNTWTFEAQKTGQSDWANFALKIEATVVVWRPTIDYALDNVNGTSYVYSGGTTDDNTPTLFGTGQSGATIEIQRLSGSSWITVGRTTVDSFGSWSFTAPILAEGAHSFRAKASIGSSQSTWTNNYDIRIDTLPTPSTPVINDFWDNVTTVDGTGARYSGQLSDDLNPTFRGTATPNTTLVFEIESDLYQNGFHEYRRINVDHTGRWEFTMKSPAFWDYYLVRAYSVSGNKYSGYSNVFKHVFYPVTLPDDGSGTFSHAEVALPHAEHIIDMSIARENTVKLDTSDLLLQGKRNLFIEDDKTQLVVQGNEGDVVQLVDILPEGSDISEWQHQEGTVTVAGVEYNVYSHNDAELLVQQGVKTELV